MIKKTSRLSRVPIVALRKAPSLPRRALTSVEFSQLADVPPETEWFANIGNPHTRRAYRSDLKEFMAFAGIKEPLELRLITRAHVIAWRKDLDRRSLGPVPSAASCQLSLLYTSS